MWKSHTKSKFLLYCYERYLGADTVGRNVLRKGSEISKDEHLSALRQCSENEQVLAVFCIVHRELKCWRRRGGDMVLTDHQAFSTYSSCCPTLPSDISLYWREQRRSALGAASPVFRLRGDLGKVQYNGSMEKENSGSTILHSS